MNAHLSEYTSDITVPVETLAVWQDVSVELKKLIVDVDKVQTELDAIAHLRKTL